MHRPVPPRVASILRTKREEQGLSAADLAFAAGVPLRAVDRAEVDKPVRPSHLHAIRTCLGLHTYDDVVDPRPEAERAASVVHQWIEEMHPERREDAVRTITRLTVVEGWRMR